MNEESKALPPAEETVVRRRRWTTSTPAKTAAFLLLPLLVLALLGSVLLGILLLERNVYARGPEELRRDLLSAVASRDQEAIGYAILRGDYAYAEEYLEGRNISAVTVYTEAGYMIWHTGVSASELEFTHYIDWAGGDVFPAESRQRGVYRVLLEVDTAFAENDEYALLSCLVDRAYALRNWLWAIAAASLLLAAAALVFLLCAAGWHRGEDRPRPGWGTRIPFDVTTLAALTAGFLLLGTAVEASYFYYFWEIAAATVLCTVALTVICVGWAMSFALRLKLGEWWKNTLTWMVCSFAWRWSRKILAFPVRFFRWLGEALPLAWQAAAVFAGIVLLEAVTMVLFRWEPFWWIFFWALERALLLLGLLYLVLMLRRLERGGRALAEGELTYQVDTRRMPGALRRHGEALNSIGVGMSRAVERQMRSERLKTELITNVSHDIKTPLTSIINYADLIGREPEGSEKTREYAIVLLRQSERLKKLIDDLVEASKASTGNLEVSLAPCQAGVLLTQAAGEYEHRLEEKGLTPVLRLPEEPIVVLADGRRLWRVLDNLMNNICKYAQPGTRVYLTLERRGGEVLMSFKNTSSQALDISAEELMERFVRGDASRSSEGSGLGLSIARSLVELQGGKLELTVDGDLFKVVLRFPEHR